MNALARHLLALGLFSIPLLLSGCRSPVPEPKVAKEPIIPMGAPGTKIIVTLIQYNQIHNGMTYSQVVNVIGHPGRLVNGTVMDAFGKAYVWRNTNGSNMVCLFKDDKLINKTDTALPDSYTPPPTPAPPGAPALAPAPSAPSSAPAQ